MISNHAPSTTRPSLQIDYFCGGESGSRTHVGLAPKPDFESGAFGHSAISPGLLRSREGRSFITGRPSRRLSPDDRPVDRFVAAAAPTLNRTFGRAPPGRLRGHSYVMLMVV